MQTWKVTVERLMLNDKVYRRETLLIMAPSPEEAQAVVHNSLEMSYEPKFRITEVKEWNRKTTD